MATIIRDAIMDNLREHKLLEDPHQLELFPIHLNINYFHILAAATHHDIAVLRAHFKYAPACVAT